MFENLNQPYPFNNNFKHNAKTIGLVGMGFVLLVLYFQPFGINFLKAEHDGYFVLGAGIMCVANLFGNTLFLPGIMPKAFNSSNWTIRKEMIWNVWLFSNLFVILSLMAWFVNHIEFTELPIFRTGALALLPLVLLNLINYNHSLKDKMVSVIDNSRRHFFGEEKPEVLNKADLQILAENGKDTFSALMENVLVFHSSGNYIEIFLLEKDICRKKLFRQSFAFVEQYMNDKPGFLKCHRCWIVNLDKIESLTGNSKGYFLELDKLGFSVPVSRNNIPAFRKIMESKMH